MSARRIEIFCPKCRWRPNPASRWFCKPECGNSWNTFETGGICPACGHAWAETQCLKCGQFSPHREWYHETAVGGPAAHNKKKKRKEKRLAGAR